MMKKLAKFIGALSIVAIGAMAPCDKTMAANGDVAINGDNFPDGIFADYVKQFDTNSDGILSLGETSAVSIIGLDNYKLRSVKGIEFFTQLAELRVISGHLEEIDLHNNTNLQKITVLNYEGDRFDVSNNPRLSNLQLDCSANARINQLDFSKNPNLYQLTVWAKSEEVGLSNIILNNQDTLRYLEIMSPSIKELDFSHCPALYELELSCNGMTNLDTSKNSNLEILKLDAMDIKQIDVSSNQKLGQLLMKECYELESLDLSKNPRVYNLRLSSKRIKSFKTSKYMELFSWTSAESLETLDLSDSPALSKLELGGAKVKELQLNSAYLDDLMLGEQGNISSIDLSHCPKLRKRYNAGSTKEVQNSAGETCHEYTSNMVLNDRTKVVNNVVIQVLPYDSRNGMTEGGGVYNTGDNVTVRAYAYTDIGYKFKEFRKVDASELLNYNKGEKVSDKSTYSFKAKEDMVLIAMYEETFPNEIETYPSTLGPRYACGTVFEITVKNLPGETSLGKMTYQWYRDRQLLSGENKATYTSKAEDLGHSLSCLVTNKDGLSKKIVFDGVIIQRQYVKAPEGLTTSATSYKGGSDGAILGTTTDMEYSSNKDFSRTFLCGNGKTANLKAGTYYVRIRQTVGHVAGEAIEVIVEDGPESFHPFVEIKGKAEVGEELYVYCDGEFYYLDYEQVNVQWNRDGKPIKGKNAWSYTITKEDIGKTISATLSSPNRAGSVTAKLASKVEKKSVNERPYGIKLTRPSKKGAADGTISGLTDKMEYSTDRTFASKKTCPNGTIKVKAGTYYVRFAETETAKAGWVLTLKISDGPTATEAFIDIKAGDWYENAVKYVFAKGIMNGVSSENFNPNGVITRAEFVTALHNLAGKPGTTKKTSFKDVKKGAWYEQAVNWAYSVKITSGLSKDKFGTDQKITRQQAAVMLYQYAKVMKLNTELDLKVLDRFPDKKDVATWGKDGLAWAVHNGVVNGKLKGKKTVLAPNANLTRAECAQMIKNMMDNTK